MSDAAGPDLHQLLEREAELQGTVRPWVRWLSVLLPVGASLIALGVIAVQSGAGVAAQVVGAAVVIFTVAGKFAPLVGVGEGSPFTALELATLVAWMDISIATALVFNLPLAYRIPRVGPILHDLADHGRYMLETKPWLGRITFFGVVLFVMFPLTGTGAVGGSIFGRLLGLSALRTWCGIALGAIVGSFGMALFAEAITSFLTPEVRSSWQFQGAGLAIVGAAIVAISIRARRVSAEIRRRKAARADAAAVGSGS